MSDLFLDTEVRWQVPSIARTCAASGYDVERLEQVFWVEVFPLAIGNMLQVAGEWISLQLQEERLVTRAQCGRMPWLLRRCFGWMVRAEFEGVCSLLVRLRVEPESRWEALVEAWSAFVCVYFDDLPCRLPSEGCRRLSRLRTLNVPLEAEWTWLEPLLQLMLSRGELPSRAARVQAVTAWLAGD